MRIVDKPRDPVIVTGSGERVELRIGEPKAGETRYALLAPKEARAVAYALLWAAENPMVFPARI